MTPEILAAIGQLLMPRPTPTMASIPEAPMNLRGMTPPLPPPPVLYRTPAPEQVIPPPNPFRRPGAKPWEQ